jgi:hypothetical protein
MCEVLRPLVFGLSIYGAAALIMFGLGELIELQYRRRIRRILER